MRASTFILGCGLLIGFLLPASLKSIAAGEPDKESLRNAINKAIPLIEASSKTYLKKRQCFSCHHQAMPVVMLSEATQRGFEINKENFQAQVERAAKHLGKGKKQYTEGKGQGGRVDTAAWALWALEAGNHQPDDTTAAVSHFLLTYQKDKPHWNPPGNRPPTGASKFASTYVALRGLENFATDDQQDELAARKSHAEEWLTTEKPKDTEDRVYRLRSLGYLGTDEKQLEAATEELLKQQREDGGWAQKDDMQSDAYATGTALVALHEAGGIHVTDERYQKGLKFLLETQLEDGSWKVETRARPIQTYFESGFPHEKGQFVSIAASSWAVTAMLLTFPETKVAAKSH